MSEPATARLPRWTWLVPCAGVALAALLLVLPSSGLAVGLAAAALVGSVLAAVHHSEVVAHRVGEPFGTLILAVAVTVIEASLIVSVMLAGGATAATLPRDTIYAAIMIVCNGGLGLCYVVGGLAHGEQRYRQEGATSALASLAALATLLLVIPAFTTTTPGPSYSPFQLGFAAICSLALWATFVFVQTVRDRDYFLPPKNAAEDARVHAEKPTAARAKASFAWLLVALVVVVGLAKLLSPAIESGVAAIGLPPSSIAIVIALLVLAPETWAAVRAARADRIQTSLNLALGSALASIGLTIPVVAVLSAVLGLPLQLGLDAAPMALLALTFGVGTLTLGIGRTNVLQGAVHLVIFGAFLVLAIVP